MNQEKFGKYPVFTIFFSTDTNCELSAIFIGTNHKIAANLVLSSQSVNRQTF